MEGLPFEKIIIDSRNASLGDATSFQVTLPETLHLPPDAVMYVTDCAISHSFRTVDGSGTVGSKNHHLYFLERNYQSGDVTVLSRAVPTSRSYTPYELATEIQTRMNEVSIFISTAYNVTYDTNKNLLNIALTYQHPLPAFATYPGFFIVNSDLLGDPSFQSFVNGRYSYSLNFGSPEDCCGLLGLARGSSANTHWPALQTLLSNTPPSLPTTVSTGSLDMRHRHVLYLHSNALSNLRIIGPAGSRSVIARIPVTSIYGGIILQQHSGHPLDCVPCGGRTLRTLDFQLKDSSGNLVDLYGGAVSFQLLFAPRPLM